MKYVIIFCFVFAGCNDSLSGPYPRMVKNQLGEYAVVTGYYEAWGNYYNTFLGYSTVESRRFWDHPIYSADMGIPAQRDTKIVSKDSLLIVSYMKEWNEENASEDAYHDSINKSNSFK